MQSPPKATPGSSDIPSLPANTIQYYSVGKVLGRRYRCLAKDRAVAAVCFRNDSIIRSYRYNSSSALSSIVAFIVGQIQIVVVFLREPA